MGAVLSTPVRLLVEAVARVAGAEPSELPGAVSLQDAAATLTAAERLRAVSLRQLADVHTRELYALDGAPSATSWVAQQHTGTERSVVTLARRLAAVPHVEAAVLDGRLSVPGAARLGAALHTLRRHLDRLDGRIDGQAGEAVLQAVVVDGVLDLLCEARGGLPDDDPLLTALHTQLTGTADQPGAQADRLEQALVVLATHLEPALLPSALDRLVGALLPLELADRADRGHRDRSFVLRRLHDGSGWSATGQLTLECGELLHTVLTASSATDPTNPADTAARAAARAQQAGPGPGGAAGPASQRPPRRATRQTTCRATSRARSRATRLATPATSRCRTRQAPRRPAPGGSRTTTPSPWACASSSTAAHWAAAARPPRTCSSPSASTPCTTPPAPCPRSPPAAPSCPPGSCGGSCATAASPASCCPPAAASWSSATPPAPSKATNASPNTSKAAAGAPAPAAPPHPAPP